MKKWTDLAASKKLLQKQKLWNTQMPNRRTLARTNFQNIYYPAHEDNNMRLADQMYV